MVQNKLCPQCAEYKSISEFNKDKSRKDGHECWCRKCSNKKHKEYFATDKGKTSKYNYWYKNRKRLNAYKKQWCDKQVDYSKKKHLKRRYGLTLEQHKQMYIEQNGCCPICNQSVPYDNICTDHCHNTNKVRGLLCYHCNLGMSFIDDIDFINKATIYATGV